MFQAKFSYNAIIEEINSNLKAEIFMMEIFSEFLFSSKFNQNNQVDRKIDTNKIIQFN